MRVLLLGEGGDGALMQSYARGFATEGHEVQTIDLARLWRAEVGESWRRIRQRTMHRRLSGGADVRLLDAVAPVTAELVVVLKGSWISAAAVTAIRQRTGAGAVVNFYPDDPFAGVRANRLVDRDAFAAYDAWFTFARHLMPAFVREGARVAYHLPFARDPQLHAPPAEGIAPEWDVVFIGNLDAERVRWLEPLADLRLAIFGLNTREAVPRRSPLRRGVTFGPVVLGREFARTLHRGRMSLNVLRLQNAQSHNMRSFESLACGAFTISQASPELSELFRDQVEIVTAASPADLSRTARDWLNRPDDRRRVAQAGFDRVRGDTYARRTGQMLQLLRADSII